MDEWMTCEGTVHSIIFQNAENGYTVLRLLTDEGEVITVVGCIPCVAPGEHLVASGVWESHPQHGEQLRVQELERTLPEDEEEIFAYLSSGICKGVGPATAQAMVDRFGAIYRGKPENNPAQEAMAQITNPEGYTFTANTSIGGSAASIPFAVFLYLVPLCRWLGDRKGRRP